MIESISQLEAKEKDVCNLPLIFAEMFKDEMNANEEVKLYNGIKRIIRKYAEDHKSLSVIDEFTRVISGGVSLEEIMKITIEEAEHPTIASEVIVTTAKDCN